MKTKEVHLGSDFKNHEKPCILKLPTMSETNKRKRKEEHCFDQSAAQMSQNKVVTTLGAEFSESDQPGQAYNIQQPIFLNQLPIVQNQQLVYQVEGVQNLNNLNFSTNGNGQQNLVYIVIPSSNENVQIETVPVEVVKKDKEGNVGHTVEFVKVDEAQEGKEAGVSEVLIEAGKGEKYYVNNATMQLSHSYEPAQQQQLQTVVQKPESVYVVEDHHVTYPPPSSAQDANPLNNNKNILRTHGYKCDYPPCTMAFSSIYEKKAHMDVHLFPESTEFKCNICNHVFAKAADRNRHVETHAVVSTFRCKNCKQAFPYYTSLVKHIDENRCVQKNKLHVCYFCGSKFVNHADLERHHEANLKVCSCKAKICGEQSFEVHANLCSAYKNKVNKCRKKLKGDGSVVVLD